MSLSLTALVSCFLFYCGLSADPRRFSESTTITDSSVGYLTTDLSLRSIPSDVNSALRMGGLPCEFLPEIEISSGESKNICYLNELKLLLVELISVSRAYVWKVFHEKSGLSLILKFYPRTAYK